ncbi:MAG: Hsp33 family molecular chaperone HslO [Planctomycetota bacterium]|nr:Hsp33 family molecular chaperone HslO [Planctomycetota bacterium]
MDARISDGTELAESRLYTFLDERREFALYFLEGQKLIYDLALLHGVAGPGFSYFREVVLSIQPMIALLKHGEQFGFYIDSEEPTFRLKLETAHSGQTRSVIWPETFAEFPESMSGKVRVQKLFPQNRPPYESILDVREQPLRAIVNSVLTRSYQVNSAVLVSSNADQSAMLHQLPPLPRADDYELSSDALAARRAALRERLQSTFDRALQDPAEVENAFGDFGFRLLSSREVFFRCTCTKERILTTLQPIFLDDAASLFDPDRESLEITCEYCKKGYVVFRREMAEATDAPN